MPGRLHIRHAEAGDNQDIARAPSDSAIERGRSEPSKVNARIQTDFPVPIGPRLDVILSRGVVNPHG